MQEKDRCSPVDETTRGFTFPGVKTARIVSPPMQHVIILDGTLSRLADGHETNAGKTYKLLKSQSLSCQTIFYEPGPQWCDWTTIGDVTMGRGINGQIRRAFATLANRYWPGDRVFLFGYSRGTYAVRSLAGLISMIGLPHRENVSDSAVLKAFRLYQCQAGEAEIRAFCRQSCHHPIRIEAICVWDTVKALGLRLPVLWRLTEGKHAFHSHRLDGAILHGFQALALDEKRIAFAPVLWEGTALHPGYIEQVWFRGNHGDVGGQLTGFHAARPLSNLPLVWMLRRAQACGLTLPESWDRRFPTDGDAPAVGSWRGWGKAFMLRRTRRVGLDPSERIHHSAVSVGHPAANLLAVAPQISQPGQS